MVGFFVLFCEGLVNIQKFVGCRFWLFSAILVLHWNCSHNDELLKFQRFPALCVNNPSITRYVIC